MPSESAAVESRRVAKPGAPQPEQEHLPCPRCDSTNTKFCYYNNYNFSQPRHFCKSCRRYWTHGGTLRDIPVGGGTRKSAKRSRTSAMLGTISNGDHFPLPATPVLVPMTASHGGAMQFGGDVKSGGGGGGLCGSFTSLLNTQGPAGFLALGGFGLGLAPGFVEDVGFGLGRGVWPFAGMSDAGGAGVVAVSGHHGGSGGGGGGIGGAATGLGNTWQYESGEHGFVGGDCFSSWPDLAISTPGNGLK